MKDIILTHSNKHPIPAEEFVAAWIIWVERYHMPAQWQTFRMPRLNAKEILEVTLRKGRAGSLDVLLRMLAPAGFRNTMQATNPFMVANKEWLVGCRATSPKRKNVQGAKLTKAALDLWNKLGRKMQNALQADAEALIEADIEVTKTKNGDDIKLCEVGLDKSEVFPYFDRSHLKISVPQDCVRDFVHWVHKDPFQPRYRKKPHGPVVTGWGPRLDTYFWPRPRINTIAAASQTALFTVVLKPLYLDVQNGVAWNTSGKSSAVTCANAVFKWGGVSTRTVTWQTIHDVMESVANGRRTNSAPMNSGWTKVGAFASTGTPNSQVIWDSRVSASLVSRLDAACVAAGLKTVPLALNGLGYVNGRGGSRPRTLILKWRNGYGCWKAQFAASIFVRDIQAYLNSNIPSFPKTNGGNWTLREVEQVLFMDGY